MSHATITIAYVNPPKQAGWSASVKTDTNEYYSIKPDMMSQFQKGQTYEVLFETNQKGYKNITSIVQPGFNPNVNRPATTNGTPSNAAFHAAPIPPAQQAAPRSTGPSPYDMVTAERIYCCGALNAAIQSGKVDVFSADEITAVTNAARAAWKATFGKNTLDQPF